MNENVFLPTLLVVVILWEFIFPVYHGVNVISARRLGNVALFPLNLIISALMKPQLFALIPLTYFAFDHGLFSPLEGHPWLYASISFILLDFSMYLQHRLLHANRLLWRMHSLHHSDSAVDFTTYFRHHPLETICSGLMTFITAIFLGVTPAILAIYLLVNNAMQLFQHSNIRLPKQIEWIEILFVTPAFHVQHHHIEKKVADTNFSTVFTLWDRLFGTHLKGNGEINKFGISGFEDELSQSIGTMLAMPVIIYNGKKLFPPDKHEIK